MADYKDLLNRSDVKALLTFARKHESPGSSYDVVYGGKDEGISKKTVQEVMDWQKAYRASPGFNWRRHSTAVGGYQFMMATLKDIVTSRPEDFPLDAKFDAALQDKAAAFLLWQKGYGRNLPAGQDRHPAMTRAKWAAEIWASLPNPATGITRYDDGLNKALTTTNELLEVLKK